MEDYSARREFLRMLQEAEPLARSEHLLRVVSSVNRDAQDAWAKLWGEIKPHVTPAGTVLPGIEQGFVPACGWPEFLEQMWLLKHYLDSMGRICQGKH